MDTTQFRKRAIILFFALLFVFSFHNSATAQGATTGAKTILVMRVDFSDAPGEPLDYGNSRQPFTLARAQNLYAQVNDFFVANSYGKTSVSATVVPDVLRLPQPISYYTQEYITTNDFTTLKADARAAALVRGYNSKNFDFDVVAMTAVNLPGGVVAKSIFGTGGKTLKGSVLVGAFFFADAAHELGHNFGLEHASRWRSSDSTPIGAGGSSIEYGDCFDMMAADCGSAITANTHFNAVYKHKLGWLPDSGIEVLDSSKPNEVHRLYPEDAPVLDGNFRALKIIRPDGRNYWVEFRQALTNNSNAASGAIIHWENGGADLTRSQLLDMTPETSTVTDAPLAVGKFFIDPANNIRITVQAKNNTVPASLDVLVEVSGLDCAYSLTSTGGFVVASGGILETTINTRSDCEFSATSNAYWLSVTSGATGHGNATVSISAAPNPGGARTGTVTIGGQTFTVTQASGSCVDSITPQTFNLPASGGNISFTHTCYSITPSRQGSSDWIAAASNPVTVGANPGAPRTGTLKLLVEDSNGSTTTVTLTVSQAGTKSRKRILPVVPVASSPARTAFESEKDEKGNRRTKF